MGRSCASLDRACLSERSPSRRRSGSRQAARRESWLVFRDSKAASAVRAEYCAHRRASLLYARNEEFGLRCLYTAGSFDVEGNVVEMASDRPKATFPGGEAQGLSRARPRLCVFYMGRAAEMPEFRAAGLRADAGRARPSATRCGCALQLCADLKDDRLRAFLEPSLLRHGSLPGQGAMRPM